jgi:hypothetical protein
MPSPYDAPYLTAHAVCIVCTACASYGVDPPAQTTLQELGPNSAIIFEFIHFKPKVRELACGGP